MGFGPAGLTERGGKARRALLQQGDVPGGALKQARELGPQVAVDLDVGALASLLPSSRERQVKRPGSGGKSRPWKRFRRWR